MDNITEIAIDLYENYKSGKICCNEVYAKVSECDDELLRKTIAITEDKKVIVVLGAFAREHEIIEFACDKVIELGKKEVAKEFIKELTGFYGFCNLLSEKITSIRKISNTTH